MKLLNKNIQEKKSDKKWVEIKINNWIPKVGDKIEGKLIKIRHTDGLIVYVLKTEQGDKINVWGKTYLNELMDEVDINDYLRITYNGIIQTKNNRQMKRFKVERRIENDKQ